ncbi:J domain-containing protein [Bradyrhizobium oligotrophicum S58]
MRWKNLNQGYKDRIALLAALPPRELLGIQANASRDDIKSAYLRMVKAYHPDVSDPFMARHNQEVLKLINTAYDQLKEGQ